MDLFSYLLGKQSGGGGGSGEDWSLIGYSEEPKNIKIDYDYAKSIYNNWTPAASLQGRFEDDVNLVYMPLVDTSDATTVQAIFKNCSRLQCVPKLDFPEVKTMYQSFVGCVELLEIPLLDTSNVTTMRAAFSGCKKLTTIPVLNTSKISASNGFQSTFSGCLSLTDESLDNILQMCINATLYGGTKTFRQLGFSANNYSVSKIEALPHYQDFTNAGWTIGY